MATARVGTARPAQPVLGRDLTVEATAMILDPKKSVEEARRELEALVDQMRRYNEAADDLFERSDLSITAQEGAPKYTLEVNAFNRYPLRLEGYKGDDKLYVYCALQNEMLERRDVGFTIEGPEDFRRAVYDYNFYLSEQKQPDMYLLGLGAMEGDPDEFMERRVEYRFDEDDPQEDLEFNKPNL
jgi:hypothetical protein